ncbi:MAG: sugar O-acetyltransferase [Rikenellaceae bacterium]|nr:sugar O-acetyltransferase [Rikenellaceae bacterium]
MATEKEKMLSGELYSAADPELVRERKRTHLLLHRLNTTEFGNEDTYGEIVGELLPHCPADIFIQPPFYCDYGSNIYCGEQAFFNYDCVVLDVAPVRIGARCFFAPKVQLYTATHPIDHIVRGHQLLEYGKPITIGDDCWIGGGSVICPGVTIGDRVVIGAGSVVTKDIPSDSVAYGNPAVPRPRK